MDRPAGDTPEMALECPCRALRGINFVASMKGHPHSSSLDIKRINRANLFSYKKWADLDFHISGPRGDWAKAEQNLSAALQQAANHCDPAPTLASYLAL